MRKQIKCKQCGKLNNNMKYCSNDCKYTYWKQHKIGFSSLISLEKSHKTNKRNRTGVYDPKIQSKGGLIGVKKSHIINKANKTGFWNPDTGSKGGKTTQKKYPNLAKEWGKSQGPKTIKLLREKKGIKFKGNYFASFGECEIGMNIHYQFNINLKEGINFQVKVGSKVFDYLVHCCFIEYHPYNNFLESNKIDPKKYRSQRRKVLNKNRYKNYPLIIIK